MAWDPISYRKPEGWRLGTVSRLPVRELLPHTEQLVRGCFLGEGFEGDNERRVEPRFPIHAPVQFNNGNVEGTGMTGNVSMSGARIDEVSEAPRAGTTLELRFSFYVGSFETPFRGRWVRPTRDGFAVEFTGLEPSQQELLRRALPVD